MQQQMEDRSENEATNKKQRFISFINRSLLSAIEDVLLRSKINDDEKLVLKLVIKDLRYSRYFIITNKGISRLSKYSGKIDCYMLFDTAKTVHYILTGKMLPLNLSLIGKVKVIYKSQKSRIFSAIYIPARSNYTNLSKGTRFTLKKS